MPVPNDQQPWSRYLDTDPIIPHPRARYYPTTLADLVEIVRIAEAEAAPKPPVRAVGSHWAPCEAAVNRDGFIVESKDPQSEQAHPERGFNKPLYNVVGKDGCLSVDAIDFFRNQGVPPFRDDDASDLSTPPDAGPGKFFLGHYEAGARIYEIYDSLDRGADPVESLAAMPGFDNYLGPWAMMTLGGAGGQTIGGAISTGTHGGDLTLPPIADSVMAMHIVGAGGQQYWFDRPLPNGARLTSNAKLLAAFGDGVIVRHDDESLDAAMVSAGRFGIIYSVVLRVVRQFALDQKTNQDPITWPDVKAQLAAFDANFSGKRFLQVIINPNGHPDDSNSHSCFVTTRNTKPLAAAVDGHTGKVDGREERTGTNAGTSPGYKSNCFSNFLCEHAGAGDILSRIFTPVVDLVVGSDVSTFVSDLITGVGDKTVGALVAELLNHFVEKNHVEFARFLCEKLIAGSGAPPDITPGAISYAVMDSHSYDDEGCTTKGVSLEAFMDARSGTVVTLVESIFDALDEMQNGNLPRAGGHRLAYGGVISLRFMQASRGLISMQGSMLTCSLELQGLGGCNGNQVFMEEITARAIGLGARMHWGQFNDTVEAATIQAQYGDRLDRWRAVLAGMTSNGRSATFSTPFTVKKGLEVVQPKIGDFSVIPRFAVAGEEGVASWNAADNPSGTTARFAITPVGGASSASAVELLSAHPFAFPVGEEDMTLEAGYVFAGVNRADAVTIRIRGFDASNPDWSTEQVATPTAVGGHTQFAVALEFLPEVWSINLRVEAISVTFGPGDGAVRWALFGPVAVARDFTATASTQEFLNRPHLVGEASGEWLFVHHKAGQAAGTGPAPTLAVRFRLGSVPPPAA